MCVCVVVCILIVLQFKELQMFEIPLIYLVVIILGIHA